MITLWKMIKRKSKGNEIRKMIKNSKLHSQQTCSNARISTIIVLTPDTSMNIILTQQCFYSAATAPWSPGASYSRSASSTCPYPCWLRRHRGAVLSNTHRPPLASRPPPFASRPSPLGSRPSLAGRPSAARRGRASLPDRAALQLPAPGSDWAERELSRLDPDAENTPASE